MNTILSMVTIIAFLQEVGPHAVSAAAAGVPVAVVLGAFETIRHVARGKTDTAVLEQLERMNGKLDELCEVLIDRQPAKR